MRQGGGEGGVQEHLVEQCPALLAEVLHDALAARACQSSK